MQVVKYVSSLLPRIERRDVRKNLDDLRTELRDHTIPPYKSALPLFKNWRFKDKFAQKFEKEFQNTVKSRFRGNYVEQTHSILNHALENIAVLEKLVDDYYSKDIVRSAMTYSKAQLLQYIEAVSFASRYARKILIYTLGVETQVERKDNRKFEGLTSVELQWLESQRRTYYSVMRALDHTPRELDKVFSSIPDIDVDPDTADNVVASVGLRKIDPLGLGMQGLMLNPIFHLRIAITEWQVARYEAAKEEKKMLEYQILDMKKALEGGSDPKVEKALEYTQDRVAKLNYKIEKMEEAAR